MEITVYILPDVEHGIIKFFFIILTNHLLTELFNLILINTMSIRIYITRNIRSFHYTQLIATPLTE